jgi:CRP-like cAMP-binding protein
MRLGEPADALFLVLEGTVRVERPGRFTRLAAGDLVGEIEVLAGGPRIANIHAEGPVRVLRVPRDALLVALEADSRVAMALIEVLASRFRETA